MSNERRAPEEDRAPARAAGIFPYPILLWGTLVAVVAAPIGLWLSGIGIQDGQGVVVGLLAVAVVLGVGGWLRKRMQLTLRSFLLIVVGLSVLLGFVAQWQVQSRRQRLAVEAIRKYNAFVSYDIGADFNNWFQTRSGILMPMWTRHLLGDDAFARVVAIQFQATHVPNKALDLLARRFPDLEQLELFQLKLDGGALERLGKLKKLRYLGLANTRVPAEAVDHLLQLRQLERIDVRRCRLGDENVAKLASLPHLEMLTCDVGDAALPAIGRMSSLRFLSIRSGRITDPGVVHLRNARNLERLDLSGNLIGDGAAEHLAGLSSLRSLTLDSTRVTDQGLLALARIQSLQTLDVRRTRVTAAGVAEVRRRRPDLKVYTSLRAARALNADSGGGMGMGSMSAGAAPAGSASLRKSAAAKGKPPATEN